MSNVDHPSHYGGETNPFETIKIIEATFTPEETIGFLKGNALKYQSRHREKGGLEDLRKGAWYSNRLVAFIEREGADLARAKPPLFWSEHSPPSDDINDVLYDFGLWEVGAISCSVEPHIRWFIRIPIGDASGDLDGWETREFPSPFAAAEYVREMHADLEEPGLPGPDQTHSATVEPPRVGGGETFHHGV